MLYQKSLQNILSDGHKFLSIISMQLYLNQPLSYFNKSCWKNEKTDLYNKTATFEFKNYL